MNHEISRLQRLRQEYHPKRPKLLHELHEIGFKGNGETTSVGDVEEIKKSFPKTFGRAVLRGALGNARKTKPLKVGVVLSGGQAAGGHNVIAGLFDALISLNPKSQLIGFLGGPSGIIEGKYRTLNAENLALYRNQGGFDLIGSGRTKIETEEQLQSSLNQARNLNLDGLVIIGGDDSNTNAAVLSEYFLKQGCLTSVIGVPKTIDGDLKNAFVGTSFGFDTACKTYSEMIGNIARDALSAKKYYHFIKLMGRSASHIALECALATRPNLTIIGEETAAEKKTLAQITKEITDVICARAEKGKNYGIILIPEGLIEFIPEVNQLIQELNQLAAQKGSEEISAKLSQSARECFQMLPQEIQKQLLLDRDPHGNVQVSLIDTEKLLIETVKKELKDRQSKGSYKGKFSAQGHFFGYEGRAGFPSNFDANYCYALGFVAALLIDEKLTGYMACIEELTRPVSDWKIAAIPITMLMHLEMRKGKQQPVIQKALVDLKGKAFSYFKQHQQEWAIEDLYRFPGPIQFFGEPELTDSFPLTLQMETI